MDDMLLDEPVEADELYEYTEDMLLDEPVDEDGEL
jgi:hypothetical protein